MFRAEVHKNIQRITEFYRHVGFWYRLEDGQQPTKREKRLKLFYLIFYSLFPISLAAGVFASDNRDEKIFLSVVCVISFVLLMKLWYIIRRQKQIQELLNEICSNYSVDHSETFAAVNDKKDIFMTFTKFFLASTFILITSEALVIPLVGLLTNERILFFSIGFPLDWRNDEFAYWVAFAFSFTALAISGFSTSFNVIVWYLMANCSWRYQVLGQQLKRMGEIDSADGKRKISDAQKDNFYSQDLMNAIASRNDLNKMTNQLDLFFSEIFVAQLTTSGVCICVSAYSLAFIRGESLIELLLYVTALFYHIFDIGMIMYFGNEITLASDKLSHHLYESNWMDRSNSIKKNVIIFGESLMIPLQLNVLKIYPISLETLKRILNSAYSMFNILKNFK